MLRKFVKKLYKINPWHFLWICVISSEIFTIIMNTIMSLLWWGEISRELLLIGTVDAFVVSLIVGALIIYFLKHTAKLTELNEQLQQEITERKKLEEQLLHAEKMKAIGTLTGGIAHEFNNILTTIIGYGEMLLENISENDPIRKYFDIINASAHSAGQLTKSLLAFSRKQIINPQPINLNDIVKNVENLLTRLIGEDIKLKTILTDEDVIVMADSGQIEQVLVNLATNARDCMPHGGILIIETEIAEIDEAFIKVHGFGTCGLYVQLSVTDSGIGMDVTTKERIFEPFFTTKDAGKGAGLGLSTVYGIIKQHNGYVHVDSELGKGSKFKIYLPKIKDSTATIASAVSHSVKGGTETVLVAEDEELVRNLIGDILKKYGYHVVLAENGDNALSLFKENKDKIQLLLLDVIMPKMNGKEVYEEIKGLQSNIKALFISGYTSQLLHKKGILDDGLNLLFKPVTKNDLLKKVREVLDT